MKSILLVFVITIMFLVGMTKFTNDTNYNEAIRYAELSQYYNQSLNIGGGGSENSGIFLETIKIKVNFEGEVKSKKTIEITYGSYLSQAIEEIGGLSSEADTRCINMNYVILEDQSFYIPGGKDLPKVSINTADEDGLMSLASVGGVTAKKIIEYRDANGKFETLEALMNVNGIGTQTFNKVKDSVNSGPSFSKFSKLITFT